MTPPGSSPTAASVRVRGVRLQQPGGPRRRRRPAVARNRTAVAERLGVPSVVFARAAHSNRVAQVSQAGPDVPGVDALITDQADLGLAAQGADCVMVALATVDGWIAAVHCGWKGLVEQIVAHTPARFDRCRSRSARRAGPSGTQHLR